MLLPRFSASLVSFGVRRTSPLASPVRVFCAAVPKGLDARFSTSGSRMAGSSAGQGTATAAAAPQHRFENPAVFVCDIQEKFRSAIWNFDKVVLTTTKLLRAAHILGIPIHVTTQNRARLGDTATELAPYLSPTPSEKNKTLVYPSVDKTKFSMYIPEIAARLPSPNTQGGAKAAQVLLVGIESHICVTQTALDLLAAGHGVYVLADGVSSCNREEVGVALARLRAEGATITTSESVVYELMGDAKVEGFKGIVGLVKETGTQTREVLQALL